MRLLIGRDSEQRRVRAAVADPDIGAVVLRGAAGAGKSALAQAQLAETGIAGGLTGMGKYTEAIDQEAFGPFLAALAQATSAALDQLYDPKAGLRSLQTALGPNLGPLSLAGFHVDGLEASSFNRLLGGREGAARVATATFRLLDWLDGFGLPVVVLIDDWSRSAPSARRLIRSLAARAPHANVTLLLTERDTDPLDTLAGSALTQLLTIGPLASPDQQALFAAALQDAAAAQAVMDWFDGGAPTLPLDILEACRWIRASGALQRVPTGWAIDAARLGDCDQMDLARGVVGRLYSPAPEAASMAHALALCGDAAPIATLAAALAQHPQQIRAGSVALEDAGLIKRDGEILSFRHDRLRTAVLERGRERETLLAAVMADRLQRALAGRGGDLALALRLRLAAGPAVDEPERWRDAFATGALDARARAHTGEALRFADEAVRLHGQAPATGDAERRVLQAAILAAADRKDATTVLLYARRLIDADAALTARADAYQMAITAMKLAGALEEGWALAREGLACLGLSVPPAVSPLTIAVELLRWRTFRSLPGFRARSSDRRARLAALAPVAHAAGLVAYERSPALAAVLSIRSLLMLSSNERRTAYWLGVETFTSAIAKDYRRAAAVGGRALSLAPDAGFGRAAALYRALFWGEIWRRPQAELITRNDDVRDLAVAEGDLVQAATAVRNRLILHWRTSSSLAAVSADIESVEAELDWFGDPTALTQTQELKRVVDTLRGAAPLQRRSEAPPLDGTVNARALLLLEEASLLGDWAAAVDLAARLAPLKPAFDSHPGGVIWRMHETLARLKSGLPARRADIRFVRRAAAQNPLDHRHKLLLLEAQRLCARGDPACLTAFAVAVTAADASAFRLEAGLAADLAADAATGLGRSDLAKAYVARAQAIWRAWGATAKLVDDGGDGRAGVQNTRLRAQAEAAERADRAKSRLLADVAHELRTPLQGMQGLLDLAGQDSKRLDLDTFREVFGSLRTVVDDLTEYGAISSGDAPMNARPCVLRDLLTAEVQLARGQPGLDRAKIELDVDDAVPDLILADDVRLRQVVRNLLSNAAKYGGGGWVRVALTRLERAPDLATPAIFEISVEDDGPGLSEADRVRLFEPFERGQRQGDGRGLGLGLALSQRIAERFGGRIAAENRPAGGSRFSFTFRAGEADSAAGPAAPPIARRRILLAEDVALSRRVIASLLRQDGHRVEEAGDGRQALERLATEAFDVLILDAAMPGASGLDVLSRLADAASHRLRRPAQCILLTASSDPSLESSAYAVGVDLVLRKPVTASELAQALSGTPRTSDTPSQRVTQELTALTQAAREELTTRIAALAADFAAQDADESAAAAHRIAGLAAQFGWPAIADLADALERALRDGGGDDRICLDALRCAGEELAGAGDLATTAP